MFVVQGQNDSRMPDTVTKALQIFKAMRDSGKLFLFVNALNRGYGYRKKEYRDIYQQWVVLFFQQTLLNYKKAELALQFKVVTTQLILQ